jgi:RNA polymerase sigma factor (sigma-70 family)
MQEDLELLRRYNAEHSEDAFTELVRRQVDLVYSAALRLADGDTHRAEDVTQQVFTELARQAQKLARHPALTGWLYTTTRRMALRARRTEWRREAREQEAHTMNELLRETAPGQNWNELRPVLDEAMHRLGDADRLALLLRYFQNKSLRDVGLALGLSENAARMRVERALNKLRVQLARRGVTSTVAALALMLTGNAVTAAPAAFVTTLSGASLAGAAAGTGTTLTLLKIMSATKLKLGIISAIVVAGLATPLVMQHEAQAKLRGENGVLRRQLDGLAVLQTDNLRLANLLAQAKSVRPSSNDPADELLRLRAEVTRLRGDSQELAKLKSAGAPNVTDPAAVEMKSWLARVNQLKQRLEQFPDKKVPELQFLTDQDWLNAARSSLDTEEDYRRALSGLRSSAAGKVAAAVQPALSQYLKEHNWQFPTDLSQLQPYLKTPMDDAVLQRYAIVPAENVPNVHMGGGSIITQKTPVDEEYDSRVVIGPNGYGSSFSEPIDTMMNELAPAAKILDSAMKAFAAANNGRDPIDPSQLQPYLKTPEEQAALQKVIEVRARSQGGNK